MENELDWWWFDAAGEVCKVAIVAMRCRAPFRLVMYAVLVEPEDFAEVGRAGSLAESRDPMCNVLDLE